MISGELLAVHVGLTTAADAGGEFAADAGGEFPRESEARVGDCPYADQAAPLGFSVSGLLLLTDTEGNGCKDLDGWHVCPLRAVHRSLWIPASLSAQG